MAEVGHKKLLDNDDEDDILSFSTKQKYGIEVLPYDGFSDKESVYVFQEDLRHEA